MSEEALAGYLLEDVLAHLLAQHGYRLLTDASEDGASLRSAGHGLLVRGRGADHQADALGELDLPVPFAHPIRLFVEAKNRASKVSLRDVRNAHGVLSDVNEAASSASDSRSMKRFSYAYALFSTAGFKSDAQQYAFAHQISLIDISGPSFKPLAGTLKTAAVSLAARAREEGLASLQVQVVRNALRSSLEGHTAAPSTAATSSVSETAFYGEFVQHWANTLAGEVEATTLGSGILFGFPCAPFVLILRVDDLDGLRQFVDANGRDLKVNVEFEHLGDAGGDWIITPRKAGGGFAIKFPIPGVLEQWLLAAEPGEDRRVQARDELLPTVFFYLDGYLVRLRYERTPVPAPIGPAGVSREPGGLLPRYVESAADSSALRALRRRLSGSPA